MVSNKSTYLVHVRGSPQTKMLLLDSATTSGSCCCCDLANLEINCGHLCCCLLTLAFAAEPHGACMQKAAPCYWGSYTHLVGVQ
jgi:hypothetical protein